MVVSKKTYDRRAMAMELDALMLLATTEDPDVAKGARSKCRKIMKQYNLTLEDRKKAEHIIEQAMIRIENRPLTREDYRRIWKPH